MNVLLLTFILAWRDPQICEVSCSRERCVIPPRSMTMLGSKQIHFTILSATIPYIARLLDITINTGTLPCDWKKNTVIPIHKGDRPLVTNYGSVSLNSIVCKQIEHVIASYLRQVWDKNNWLYKGQHEFKSGYPCGRQVITVCQVIADPLDNGDKIDAIIVDFSKAFDLVPHGRLLTKIATSGVDSKVVVWIRDFFLVARRESG
jgi:hypothetical protein